MVIVSKHQTSWRGHWDELPACCRRAVSSLRLLSGQRETMTTYHLPELQFIQLMRNSRRWWGDGKSQKHSTWPIASNSSTLREKTGSVKDVDSREGTPALSCGALVGKGGSLRERGSPTPLPHPRQVLTSSQNSSEFPVIPIRA